MVSIFTPAVRAALTKRSACFFHANNHADFLRRMEAFLARELAP